MRVISIDEAAKKIGVCRRTFERMLAEGEGPAIIFVSERRRGVLEDDLVQWILARRHPAPGEAKPN